MKFLPGQYNKEADVLFRWRRTKESRGTNAGDGRDAREKDESGRALVVNVSKEIDDYVRNVLHSDHMGLAGMLHKRRNWGLIAL